MKSTQAMIQLGFRTLSAFSPETAGKIAAKLFQRNTNKRLRSHEAALLEEAETVMISHERAPVYAYAMGPEHGKLVFLVHGWASWAGSMLGIGRMLANLGYRVISFDFPAHGQSSESHTNLLKMAQAFQSVLAQVNPSEPFSVVAHSLGSGAVAHALSESGHELDQLVFLTSPDSFLPIFSQFAQYIGLNRRGYEAFLDQISLLVRKEARDMKVSTLTNRISYQRFSMIHSRQDRVIPFRTTEGFVPGLPNSQLFELEKVGHYRMLWSEEVWQILERLFSRELARI